MEKELQENVENVLNSMAEYQKKVVSTGRFNFSDFVNFMEAKFKENGYRPTTAEETKKQTNILILHDSGVGDFILMSGAIREIRRLYPKAHITLLIYPRSTELAELCPYVDEVLTNPRSTDWYKFIAHFTWNIKIVRQLLERQFDICFSFAHYPDTLFLMYLSGAAIRVTYDYPDKEKDFIPLHGDIPVTVAVNLANVIVPRHRFGWHMVDMNFSLVDGLLHSPVANRELEIWYSPADFTVAKSILRNVTGKIYALCFGGMNLQKCYPPEMYAKVMEMIFEYDPNTTFVILGGGKNDSIQLERLKKTIPEKYHSNILNLIGRVTYRQSGAVLKFCDMYIGNDTGTMHMAAAMKCPVLMPKCFPMDLPQHYSDSPKLHYPYGVPNITIQPEHALPECSNNEPYSQYGCREPQPHCITQIKPETVFEAFKQLEKRIAENNIEPMYMS